MSAVNPVWVLWEQELEMAGGFTPTQPWDGFWVFPGEMPHKQQKPAPGPFEVGTILLFCRNSIKSPEPLQPLRCLQPTARSSSGAAWRALRAWKPKTLPWLIPEAGEAPWSQQGWDSPHPVGLGLVRSIYGLVPVILVHNLENRETV